VIKIKLLVKNILAKNILVKNILVKNILVKKIIQCLTLCDTPFKNFLKAETLLLLPSLLNSSITSNLLISFLCCCHFSLIHPFNTQIQEGVTYRNLNGSLPQTSILLGRFLLKLGSVPARIL